jgi:FAD:protein FMN transferase
VATGLSFRAMGTDCHVIVIGGADGSAAALRRRVDDLEQKWSRFRDDSEVSRLNRAGGEQVRVSADTITLVRRAVDGWHLSGGSFDPTVLGAVIRSGYAVSFDRLGREVTAGHSSLGLGVTDLRIDGDRVTVPHGIGFDPGGIGKGLAADVVAGEAIEAGAEGVCVNLGGDIRVCGAAPDGGGWTIGIEHPWLEDPVGLLGIGNGAVATSTTLRRTWRIDGARQHHLIDPQTGRPSDTDLNLATVVCAEAWAAEVLAKAVLLHGSAHPFDILGGTGAQGLAVGSDGRVGWTPGLTAYLGEAPLPARLAA